MPLPKADTPWPPVNTQPLYAKMAEWAAWYSGEPSRIIDVYSSRIDQSGGTIPWYRFWRRAAAQRDGSQRALLHVPLASDLASVSGSLLFGESPRFRIKEAHEDEQDLETPATQPNPMQPDPTGLSQADPTAVDPMKAGMETAAPKKKGATPAEKTERRLGEIIDRADIRSRLIEAAESAAAIGGVYVYPAWDKDLWDHPVMAVAQADQALPEFKWGFLTAVTFHRILESNDGRIWRHLERHEVQGTGDSRKAHVLHALYVGNESSLGEIRSLNAHQDTAKLVPDQELPFGELDAQYVPNMMPNRLYRAAGHGIADISGSETLLDAIDETYASWMRDVRLAKARIIVPRDYLRVDPDNRNAPTFDIDQEIYTGLEMEPSMNSDSRAMLAAQFDIRYLEHRSTARELIERVVSNAGYAPATLGQATDSSGVARTGAALRVSEHKTVLTQRRKAMHWKRALEMVCRHLLLIDKEEFGGQVLVPAKDLFPKVEMSDSVIDQPLELAQTALAMKSAESASIETRVKTLHPDWTDSEVASEVARITDEKASDIAAQGAGGFGTPGGSFGDPDKDPSATGSFPLTDKTPGRQTRKPPVSPPFAKKAE